MLIVDRWQQIITLVLVMGSAVLLAIAQHNPELAFLGAGAALAAFVLNDWLEVLTFNRWVANAAAIFVTAFTLRNFLNADSTSQLFMIANLLVYLQIVLMFQRKTPRVYWQILVLSLLQVVVAAAFNIGFEGGLVFLGYILLSAVMMLILQVHTQTTRIRIANRRTADALGQVQQAEPAAAPLVLTMFDQVSPDRRLLWPMIRHVMGLGSVAVAFAAVAFFLLPRDQESWSGAPLIQFQVPGASRAVDLQELNDIYLSEQPVFEAGFGRGGKYIELSEKPYFQGMPLPNLQLRDGQTTWVAPFDRVYGGTSLPPSIRTANYLIESVQLEPTNDPLLFSVQPAHPTTRSAVEVEWSNQLGVFSRSGDLQSMSGASFSYDLRVALRDRERNLMFRAIPYQGINAPTRVPLNRNPGEYKWLTDLPREHYPQTVELAQKLKGLVPDSENHFELAYALCNHLAAEGGFSYTLQIGSIPWDPEVDRIEDFVVRHKRGHCELFASALVVMLRSLEIPARVVIGFHGGKFDGTSNTYRVRQKDAHAWVEAYIRPEDCPAEWRRTGETDRQGSWLRLDPTPASEEVETSEEPNAALDAAKSFWKNYVMGLNSEKQRESLLAALLMQPLRGWGTIFTLSYWKLQWQLLTDPNTWYSSAFVKLAALLAAAYVLWQAQHWWTRRGTETGAGTTARARSRLQRWLGQALGVVSPRLGRWVGGERSQSVEVPFFSRLQRLLERIGLTQQPAQTAREFALAVRPTLAQHPRALDIQSHIEKIVDYFYRVRFRGDALSAAELHDAESSLNFLEAEVVAKKPS